MTTEIATPVARALHSSRSNHAPEIDASFVAARRRRWLLRGAIWTVVAAHACSYWIGAFAQFAGDPLSVLALYRPGGDVQYFPLIEAVTAPTLGETSVLELYGEGIRAFPLTGLLPHGILVGLLGTIGFLVADVLLALAYFEILRALLRRVGLRSPLADAGALFVATKAFRLVFLFVPPTEKLLPIAQFWAERIPRPLVTEIYFVLALTVSAAILSSPAGRTRLRTWMALGAVLAVVTQSDVFSGFVLLPAAAALLVRELAVSRGVWRPVIGRALSTSAVFVVVLAPFLVQQASLHPDVPRRYGVFETTVASMPSPLTFYESVSCGWWAGVVLVAVVTGGILRLLKSARSRRGERLVLGAAVLVSLAALAPWYSVLLLGKTLQPYQFVQRLHTSLSYAALLVTATAVTVLWRSRAFGWARPRTRRWTASAITGAVVLASVITVVFETQDSVAAQPKGHVRPDFPYYADRAEYRTDFTALVRWLEDDDRAHGRAVGTFDHQVFAWWLAFGGGFIFNPDPFVSSAPDAEVERRLMLLCRTLRMSATDFAQFVQRRYVTILWLSCDKYQASSAHTFAPLSDYPREVRELIPRTRFQDSWFVAIPTPEVDRLVKAYRHTLERTDPGPRLDTIVLTAGEHWTPDDSEFELVWSNATFRVFERIGSR